MKLKDIWNEFYTKVLPLLGIVSIIMVCIELLGGFAGQNFAFSLLGTYVSLTVWHYFLVNYLNKKILPRYIKNMRGDTKISMFVFFIEGIIWGFLVGSIAGFLSSGEINFGVLLPYTGYIAIFLAIFLVGVYWVTKIYQKRINKKLEEYKKQNGEPITRDFEQPRIEMLREFADYSSDEKYRRNITYEYTLGEKEKYRDIIKKYGLDSITAGKEDLDLIFALCRWASDTFGEDGNSGFPAKRGARAIIKFAKKNRGINCWLKCTLLAEMLRAYGIKAYHVHCQSFEEPYRSTNSLVHAYSESLKKWIMLDPVLYVHLKDKNGNIINIPEFRNIIITGEEFYVNADAKNFWGETVTPEKYREIMATYMFRFSRAEKHYYGSDIGLDNNPVRQLIPEKYLKYTENFSEYNKQSFVLSEKDFWET